MSGSTDLTELPSFLRSAEVFLEHLNDQFSEEENPNKLKGESFVAFACKVLPLCDFWRDYGEPIPNPKRSHDKGGDIEAQHRTGQGRIIVQPKYRIRDVATLDTVLSQFAAYEQDSLSQTRVEQQDLFAELSPSRLNFVIVTISNLDEICRHYEESRLPASDFYRKLRAAGRLFILDGNELLVLLQSLYRQSYCIAPQIELELSAPILEVGNVRLSVVSGAVLRHLYKSYGSSLFFENIREFLGPSEDGEDKDADVNAAITETLRNHPDKMLGRDNGITFHADSVERIDDRRLRLHGGSIVNGCQTTMCVVNAGELASEAMIVAKVVIGGGSWEVARAANYHNRVTRIDLELARFLRPQLVRKVATDLGFGVPTTPQANISNVLEDIHRTKIRYNAIKLLYIGLFSRYPRSLIDNYSEVRLDVLSDLYDREKYTYVMRVLFELYMRMQESREAVQKRLRDERFIDAFKRFFRQDQLKYQCLLAILTACGCVNDDLVDKSSASAEETRRMLDFIAKLEIVLHRNREYFERTFRAAFMVIAQRLVSSSDSEQEMLRDVASASGPQFRQMVISLRLQMNGDDYLYENPPDFSAVDFQG